MTTYEMDKGEAGAGKGTVIENVLGIVREAGDPLKQIDRIEDIQRVLAEEKGHLAYKITPELRIAANSGLHPGIADERVRELSDLAARHAISSNETIIE